MSMMKLHTVVANDVTLHYVEQGEGVPLVLVHGGLADYREWEPQMERFAATHRVIAYSRRYNYPNQNPVVGSDHSALVEAKDLAALIRALGLARSHVVGYSYGAFTALCLALEHPELVHSLVLAEPPVLRWALGLPSGDAAFAEFMAFWGSVGQAFRDGKQQLALRTTADFFFGAGALDGTPPEVLQMLEDNLQEWEALTTARDAYPMIAKERVAHIQQPTLLLTAERTHRIHQLVNDELARVMASAQRVIISDATHEMWSEQPEACERAAVQFLRSQEAA
jgi:pimeloyl-ACP methyl ester carboxylesterase